MSDIAKVHDIAWYAEVPRSIWKQTAIGVLLLAVTFGGFGTWAFTAPLAAAVIAQGSFVATGRNKIVQHFEGGIIKELLVNEGDEVVEGEPLVRLDETAAQARQRELFLRRIRLEATAARLTSQSEGNEKMTVSSLLQGYRETSDVWSIVVTQQLNFKAQHLKLQSELSLLQQNVRALAFRAEGYARQKRSASPATDAAVMTRRISKEKLLQEGAGAVQRHQGDTAGDCRCRRADRQAGGGSRRNPNADHQGAAGNKPRRSILSRGRARPVAGDPGRTRCRT